MRHRLATIAVLMLCAVAASGAAQEPADAPSPQLMAVYQVTPGAEGAAGRAEARRQIEALRAELRRLASRQAQSSRDVASAQNSTPDAPPAAGILGLPSLVACSIATMTLQPQDTRSIAPPIPLRSLPGITQFSLFLLHTL